MPEHLPLDKDFLKKLIEVDLKTHKEAANIFGVSRDTIGRRCKQYGIKTQKTGPRRGHLHKGWKGGRRLVKGYVYLYMPEHPNCTKSGYVAEHRLAMEKKIGRYLKPSEVVHHLNDIPDDNRLDNLELYSSNAKHLQETLRGHTPNWTQEGKERIQKGLIKRANQIRKGIGVPPRNQYTGRFEAKLDKSSP